VYSEKGRKQLKSRRMKIFLGLPILEVFPQDLQNSIDAVTKAYTEADYKVVNYYDSDEVREWIKDRNANKTKILLKAYELLLSCDTLFIFKMADYGIYTEVGDFRNMALNRLLDIENELKDERRPKYIFNHILRLVSKYYAVHPDHIRQRDRSRKVVEKRQMLFLFTKEYTSMSLDEIGENCSIVGEKKLFDHSTVLYGLKTIRNLIDTDKRVRSDYQSITQALKDSQYIFNRDADVKEEATATYQNTAKEN
jgi:hypothetical protein